VLVWLEPVLWLLEFCVCLLLEADPGSNSTNPGTGPNTLTPSPDDGSNNNAPFSGQPNYTGHLEPENGQSGYSPISGEISNKTDDNNHDKERTHSRPEISDPWQTTHHLHEPGTTIQDNQLEHKDGRNHHHLLAHDLREQNHSQKHTHTHKAIEPRYNNDRLPVNNNDILIGQLVGLLNDTKKDPKQEARTYVVKAGDTLESIASDVLFDFKLGLLIYIINKAILPAQVDWQQCKLREGTVLFLPEEAEIRSFRLAMIEKEKQAGTLISRPIDDQLATANSGAATTEILTKRRLNIERLLGPLNTPSQHSSLSHRQQVAVRLGDTLRSIALKNHCLQDVSLWKFLAQLNELSTGVDTKGAPIAILTRGMVLQLPTAEEIAEYRAQQAAITRTTSPRKALQAEVLNLA